MPKAYPFSSNVRVLAEDGVEQIRAPEQGTGAQARAALAVSLASLESGRPEDVV